MLFHYLKHFHQLRTYIYLKIHAKKTKNKYVVR
jgi:hypothetical protein